MTIALSLCTHIAMAQTPYKLPFQEVQVSKVGGTVKLFGIPMTGSTTMPVLLIDANGRVYQITRSAFGGGLPNNSTITINGTTYNLSSNPSLTTGTVTGITANSLSPLFTTTVTGTTIPQITHTAVSQSGNLFFASPNGSSGVPIFRSVGVADLPVVDIAHGGLGLTSTPAVNAVIGVGTGGNYVPKTFAAGAGIALQWTNDVLTITNTGGGGGGGGGGTVTNVIAGIAMTGGGAVTPTLNADTTILQTKANSNSLSQLQTRLSGYTPTSRTLTINGVTQDFSTNRSYTIPANTINGANGVLSSTVGSTVSLQADTTTLSTKANSTTLAQLQIRLNGYTPSSRTFTINGTPYDFTANRTITTGTVNNIVFNNGLTGGTVTNTGTVGVDTTNIRTVANSLTKAQVQTKVNALVPNSRNIILNGTTYPLTADVNATLGTVRFVTKAYGITGNGTTFQTSGSIAVDSTIMVNKTFLASLLTAYYTKLQVDSAIAASGGGGGGGTGTDQLTPTALTNNASSYTINSTFTSKTYTFTNNLTAFSFAFTNIVNGDEITFQYSKTTASDATLTFPAGSIIKDDDGIVTGVSDLLTSTATGVYLIGVKRIGSSYFVGISKFKI